MGKLVVTEFVSIDGVFEDPGGAEDYEHGGWTFEYDPAMLLAHNLVDDERRRVGGVDEDRPAAAIVLVDRRGRAT